MPHPSLAPRPRVLCVDLRFIQGFRCFPQSTCLVVLCGRGGKEHRLLQKRLGWKGCSAHHLPHPGRPPGWAWSSTADAGRIHHCLHAGESTTKKAVLSIQHSRNNSPTILLFFFLTTPLDPYQGSNPMPPALVVRGLNHCPTGEVLSLALNTSQDFQEMGEGVLGLASLSLESSQAAQEETTRYCHVMRAS